MVQSDIGKWHGGRCGLVGMAVLAVAVLPARGSLQEYWYFLM